MVVFEFLSLQTCMNSWAESLETPSHLRPGGPGTGGVGGGRGGGAGDWHVDDLSSKPVCQALDRAYFLQNSWGLAGGGRVGKRGFSLWQSPLREKSHPVRFPQIIT